MRAHIIESGLVVNSIEVEDLNFPVSEGQTLIDGKEGGIGWAWDGNALTPPASETPNPTLDDLKDAKIAEINTACLAAIDGGFEHGGHVFDSDPRSKSNIIGTATGVTAGVPLPEGFTWRTQDNQDVPMDGPAIIALGAALLQHINTQYAISWQLKAQVDSAPDEAALDTINWPA